jgi:gliding motility-associated-like protein
LSSPYQNTSAYTQTIFVKVTNNNQCFAISPLDLEVLYTPIASDDETVIYCLNTFPQTIRLFGGVLNDSPSNYYYEWLFNGNATSVNTSFIDINETGTYTVIITDPNGCFTSRTITVTPSNIATIENISIQEGSFNNTIIVNVSGEGDYEYALDDINGLNQTSNVFTNVQPGFHTVYVRDVNDCGITEELVSVLGFPRFFTPNGDTYNDTWRVYGTNAQFNQGIDVKIFNRYGKLLAQFDHLSAGWDGTLNGNLLPSDDYWFVATLTDGRTYNGHFSLKR